MNVNNSRRLLALSVTVAAHFGHPRTRIEMIFRKADLLIIVLSGAAFVLLFGGVVSSHRFGFDEADYMYAVGKGFYANFVDQQGLSFANFFAQGLRAAQELADRVSLSEYIRQSDDTPFYRHYHGPLYFYWLMSWSFLFGNSEYIMRLSGVALHLLTFTAIYLGSLLVFEKKIPSVVSAGLFLSSPTNIATATQITPHSLYVLFVIVGLFAMAKLLRTKNLNYFSLSTVCVCFAVLTLEYAVLLVLTFGLCVLFSLNSLFLGFSRRQTAAFLLKQGLLFVGVFMVLWPGGLLKLTILKNYLFFLYFTLFRSDSYGKSTFFELWWSRISSSPFEYSLLVGSLLLFIFSARRSKNPYHLLPFLLYGIFVFATTFRNRSTAATYISSLLPPLYVIVGYTASNILSDNKLTVKWIAALFLLLIPVTNGQLYLSGKQLASKHAHALDDLVSYIRSAAYKISRCLCHSICAQRFIIIIRTLSSVRICRERLQTSFCAA